MIPALDSLFSAASQGMMLFLTIWVASHHEIPYVAGVQHIMLGSLLFSAPKPFTLLLTRI
jgi:hypothetical protein